MRLAALFIVFASSDAFYTSKIRHTSTDILRLLAKSTKAKPKGGGGGGFGAASSPVKQNNDYKVFPKLEPQVSETLVASKTHESITSLPMEVYDRLEQIYGFPEFNAQEAPENNETHESSLADLMSSGSEASAASSSSSSSILDDLLSGAPSPSPVLDMTSTSPRKDSPSLSVHNIPPFNNFRVLQMDPMILAIDDFFTPEECDRYVAKSNSKEAMQSRSPTVGKDNTAKAQRTSTTWYHHFSNVPELMAKASRLLGLQTIDRWEEPQTVRYRGKEKFTWHLDALGPGENQAEMGGQRVATLLVYLTELDQDEGGATMFRDLGVDDKPLRVEPKKGSALLFFPAAGGIPNVPFDVRTLHCGEAVTKGAKHEKWIAQLWLREKQYTPTAPPENNHSRATEAISEYCKIMSR